MGAAAGAVYYPLRDSHARVGIQLGFVSGMRGVTGPGPELRSSTVEPKPPPGSHPVLSINNPNAARMIEHARVWRRTGHQLPDRTPVSVGSGHSGNGPMAQRPGFFGLPLGGKAVVPVITDSGGGAAIDRDKFTPAAGPKLWLEPDGGLGLS